eukprot:g25762.t1
MYGVSGFGRPPIVGGPHLGDCALWAANSIGLVGVRVRAIAYEPLPDAAGLFQQSVLENGFGGAVESSSAAQKALNEAMRSAQPMMEKAQQQGRETLRRLDQKPRGK